MYNIWDEKTCACECGAFWIEEGLWDQRKYCHCYDGQNWDYEEWTHIT